MNKSDIALKRKAGSTHPPAPPPVPPHTEEPTPVEPTPAAKPAPFFKPLPPLSRTSATAAPIAQKAQLTSHMQTPEEAAQFIADLRFAVTDQESQKTIERVTAWVENQRAAQQDYGGIITYHLKLILRKNGTAVHKTAAFLDPESPSLSRLYDVTSTELPTQRIHTPPFFLSQFGFPPLTGNLHAGKYKCDSFGAAKRDFALIADKELSSLPICIQEDQRHFIDSVMRFQMDEVAPHYETVQVPPKDTPKQTIEEIRDDIMSHAVEKAQPAIRGYYDPSAKVLTIKGLAHVCNVYNFDQASYAPATDAAKPRTEDEIIAKCIQNAKQDWKIVDDNPVFFGITLPDGTPNEGAFVEGYEESKKILAKKTNLARKVYGYNDVPVILADENHPSGIRLCAAAITAISQNSSDWLAFAITELPTPPPKAGSNIRLTVKAICLIGRALGKPVFSKKDDGPAVTASSLAFGRPTANPSQPPV